MCDKEKMQNRVTRSDEERTRMIQSYLPLVRRIAGQFLGNGIPLDDLIQEGSLGLIRAVDSYLSDDDDRFADFASNMIEHFLRKAVIDQKCLRAFLIGNLNSLEKVGELSRRAEENIESECSTDVDRILAHLTYEEKKAIWQNFQLD